jgi:hypothetical protein
MQGNSGLVATREADLALFRLDKGSIKYVGLRTGCGFCWCLRRREAPPWRPRSGRFLIIRPRKPHKKRRAYSIKNIRADAGVAWREERKNAINEHRGMHQNRSLRLSSMRPIPAGSELLLDAAGSIQHRSWLVVMSFTVFFRLPIFPAVWS